MTTAQTQPTKIKYKEQVENVAMRTGLTRTQVKDILDYYKVFALIELREHRVFRFGHIATVYSNEIDYAETPATLAHTALNISHTLDYPYHITLGVLTNYVELAEESLRQGRSFDIVGIIKLKTKLQEETGTLNVHVALSKHIYNALGAIDYRLRTGVLSTFRVLFLETEPTTIK